MRGLSLRKEEAFRAMAEKARELGADVPVSFLEEIAQKAAAVDQRGNVDIVAMAAYIEANLLRK